MAVINIKTVSKMLENNAPMRGVVKWVINFILHLFEAQGLIDFRKLQRTSLDWDRGTLDLGDDFTEQLIARSVNEYVIKTYRKRAEFKVQSRIRKDSEKLETPT